MMMEFHEDWNFITKFHEDTLKNEASIVYTMIFNDLTQWLGVLNQLYPYSNLTYILCTKMTKFQVDWMENEVYIVYTRFFLRFNLLSWFLVQSCP